MTKDKDHINIFLLATIYKYVGKKELHILPKQKFSTCIEKSFQTRNSFRVPQNSENMVIGCNYLSHTNLSIRTMELRYTSNVIPQNIT